MAKKVFNKDICQLTGEFDLISGVFNQDRRYLVIETNEFQSKMNKWWLKKKLWEKTAIINLKIPNQIKVTWNQAKIPQYSFHRFGQEDHAKSYHK